MFGNKANANQHCHVQDNFNFNITECRYKWLPYWLAPLCVDLFALPAQPANLNNDEHNRQNSETVCVWQRNFAPQTLQWPKHNCLWQGQLCKTFTALSWPSYFSGKANIEVVFVFFSSTPSVSNSLVHFCTWHLRPHRGTLQVCILRRDFGTHAHTTQSKRQCVVCVGEYANVSLVVN